MPIRCRGCLATFLLFSVGISLLMIIIINYLLILPLIIIVDCLSIFIIIIIIGWHALLVSLHRRAEAGDTASVEEAMDSFGGELGAGGAAEMVKSWRRSCWEIRD